MSPTAEAPRRMTVDQLNHVRFTRATVKRDLREAESKAQALRMVADHLEDPVPEIEKMLVFDLLAAGYRCGPAVALDLLKKAKVGGTARVGSPEHRNTPTDLTDAARERLVVVLRDFKLARPGPSTRAKAKRAAKPKTVAVTATPAPAITLAPAPEQPGPSLSRWCPVCAEFAIPMVNGTCGFCDTQIEDAA